MQVHPSPAYARAHPDAHLKTESWYILRAQPDAVIYKGIKPGVSREQFAAHARSNSPDIVRDLIALPAIPGECHNLPSGTVHALGAGVLDLVTDRRRAFLQHKAGELEPRRSAPHHAEGDV